MGELNGETALADPLGLTGREELIDDALGGVDEVTELGLPDNVRVRVDHRVAELEAHDGVLGQGGVADCVVGLVGRQG